MVTLGWLLFADSGKRKPDSYTWTKKRKLYVYTVQAFVITIIFPWYPRR
jgi:hypothetical protein